MNLFDGVHYLLSSSLSPQRSSQLSHILDINGALLAHSIHDNALTHFIANSNRFEHWQDVAAREEAGQLCVVSDKWVERSVLLGKVQPTAFYSTDPAMIFSGVVACATELPATDLEVLSAGITALGGQWRVGLTKDVTHLFAMSPSGPKYTTALHFQEQTRIKVLLPRWFDDAVRIGMAALDTTPYEWPEPVVLKGPPTPALGGEGVDKDKEKEEAIKKATRKVDAEKKALYKTASLWTPADPLPMSAEPTSSTSSLASPVASTKNVWQGRRVLLSSTLELVSGRKEAVEIGIARAGGVVVHWNAEEQEGSKTKAREADMVEQCDVFVTRFRTGKAYARAIRHAKTVGTLPWMFHVQSTGVLSPPMDQLLWYPIPKKPIDGFSGHEITVTNYTGEAREYLKKLIMAMGATFTPSMSGKNTVLIAAYISGTKTTKAAAWSIPIVNHTWLEDCFVKWRNLTMALEKYIVFPSGVDFATMLGERGVGRLVEEMVEEELQALEAEDEDGEDGEMGDGEVMGNGEMVPPIGTENSARDAREVEDVVGLGGNGDGDVEMNFMVNGDEHGDEHDSGMDVDHVHASNKKRKRDSGREDKEEQALADDEDGDDEDEDEAVIMRPRKKASLPASQTPTQTQRKSLTSRLQEKGGKGVEVSAAKTRVKKSKPKEKEKEKKEEEEEEDGARDGMAPEVVRVTKRRSGKLEVQVEPPQSRRKKGRALESELEQSSDDDTIEFVEVTTPAVKDKGKGKMSATKKLVRRAGQSENSWMEDVEEQAKAKKGKKTPGKKVDGGDEEEVKVKVKKLPARTVSSDEEEEIVPKPRKMPVGNISSDEEEEIVMKKSKKTPVRKALARKVSSSEEEQEEVVLPKTKPKAKKTPLKRVGSDEEMEEQAEEEEEEVEPAKPKRTTTRTPASATTTKGKGKAKVISVSDDDEGESEIEYVTPSKVKARTKNKDKVAEKPKERPRPRSISKAAVKAKAVDQTTELEDDEEDEELLPVKSTKKATRVTTSSAKKAKQTEPVVVSPSSVSPTSKTSKRTVSVLVPHLTLTPKISPQQTSTPAHLTRTDSIRVAAGELPRTSTGRPSASVSKPTAGGSGSAVKAKAKTKVVEAECSPAPSAVEEGAVVTSGRSKRSAATKASQKLHDEIMPDVVSYQLEMRNNKGKGRKSFGEVITNGSAKAGKGKTPVTEEEEEEEEVVKPVKANGKAKAKKAVRLDASESEDGDVQILKKDAKAKKGKEKVIDVDSPRKSGSIRLMTTQVTLPEDVVKTLTKLGVKMTTRAAECTHLLAPALVRTEKFLCALAVAPFILTEKWATESAAAKTLLSEHDYTLVDKATERKYGLKLHEAIERARELKGGLFAKKTFYITPKVIIDIKLLKNVITACGGQISTQVPTLRIMNSSSDRHVVSCAEDMSIWRPIAIKYPIYTHEMILTSALRQKVEWGSEEFRVLGSLDYLEE